MCRAWLSECVEFKNRTVFFRYITRQRYKTGRLSETVKLVGDLQKGEKAMPSMPLAWPYLQSLSALEESPISLCSYMQQTSAEQGGRCKLSIWSSSQHFSPQHQPGEEMSWARWPEGILAVLQGSGGWCGGRVNPGEPPRLVPTLIPPLLLQHAWGAQGRWVHSNSPSSQEKHLTFYLSQEES